MSWPATKIQDIAQALVKSHLPVKSYVTTALRFVPDFKCSAILRGSVCRGFLIVAMYSNALFLLAVVKP